MPKAPKAVTGKSKKVLHPNSRRAAVLVRQSHHEQKVTKSKSDTANKQEQLRQKLLWFQDNMDQNKKMYSKPELAELTHQYLLRFKDELEQISIVNSVGNRQATSKQHAAREAAIRLTEERDKMEFEGVGIEVPDLVNGKTLAYFRDWTGEIQYFPHIKLRKSKKSDLNTDSTEVIGGTCNATLNDCVEAEELPDYVE